MKASDIVMQTVAQDAETFTIRATMFVGNHQPTLDIAADLLRAGHRLEAQDIPGLWRIDGGPELTTAQMRQVAGELLSRS